MRIEIASNKAIKVSCINYHYAKSIPACKIAYSVYSDQGEFCGCIVYGHGANLNIGNQYGLLQGECLELVRVALNGKQLITSKALALTLNRIKQDIKILKLIVSYADSNQGHLGIIYQATNWYYVGETNQSYRYYIDGILSHKRKITEIYNTASYYKLKELINIKKEKQKSKHKYLFPLNKKIRKLCEKIKLEYPKAINDNTKHIF